MDSTQAYIDTQEAMQRLAEALFNEIAQEQPDVDLLARRMLQTGAARLRVVATVLEADARPTLRLLLDPLEAPGQPVELAAIGCPHLHADDDAEALAARAWFVVPLRELCAAKH